jgi:hypothetical protein
LTLPKDQDQKKKKIEKITLLLPVNLLFLAKFERKKDYAAYKERDFFLLLKGNINLVSIVEEKSAMICRGHHRCHRCHTYF